MKIVQYNENNVITRIQKPHDSFLENSTTTHMPPELAYLQNILIIK